MKKLQYAFYFDASRCTGCKTCVIACKDKNNIQQPGIQLRRVYEESGGDWIEDEAAKTWKQNIWAYFVSVSCNHCDDPACVKVCPTGAHAKHFDLGGLVLIDGEKCIGCGAAQLHALMKHPSWIAKNGKCVNAICAWIGFPSKSFQYVLLPAHNERLILAQLKN